VTLDFRNTNTLWASVLTETLVRLGLKLAVVSPGSRSTPLTVALALHPDLEVIPVLDERSAGFLALGAAKRAGQPVVLVCTSGTAGANYYPAVIEAHESGVPLLLLTADRPPELRDCASGQTIDQQKLFGDFPNWYMELATPQADMGQLRYLRQTLVQAWQRSLHPDPGPVHLNCPFRDPLAPTPDATTTHLKDQITHQFFTFLSPSPPSSPPPSLPPPSLLPPPSSLLLIGPTHPPNAAEFCAAIATLSQKLHWPVLAEGLSPVRNFASLNPHLITTYDAILRQSTWAEALVPDQVIQIGPLPTSKVLRQWLERTDPLRWVVGAPGRNLDPLHGRTLPLNMDVVTLAHQVERSLPASDYLQRWLTLEQKTRQRLDAAFSSMDDLFEGKLPWQLAHTLPPGTPLMIANSMPVRDLEWFWPPSDRQIQPYFNRGANGIDGTLSTALGIAHGNQPAVLLTGDLAFLHDTNGLLSVPHLRGHLTILVVNNNGGGIFEMLPIAQFEPPFETYFATPQTVDLPKLCAAYGVDYSLIESWPQFEALLSTLPPTGVRLLEVKSDRYTTTAYRKTLIDQAAAP
jgi:2-succinyl-5-enolpyruvyl-6-hydroxy-3-cyclohexene-1-carboxylate synthase